jgi:hypothetical protein
VSVRADRNETCPHCGAPLDAAHRPTGGAHEIEAPPRYDLEAMAALAQAEKAYDETVKVRVTQDDIRKLMAKRRKKAK